MRCVINPFGFNLPAITCSINLGSKRFTDAWLARMVKPLFTTLPIGTIASIGPYTPTIETTPPFGHEFTGIVEEIGSGVQNLKVGDHVLVPFNIACGTCPFCKQELFGNCHESNPGATAVGGIFWILTHSRWL